MKNFTERLERAIAQSGKPKGEFARHMGVALSTVSRWLGGTMPNGEKILQIAEFLGVDALWLTHGIGAGPGGNEASTVREDAAVYIVKPQGSAEYAALLEKILPALGASELMETIEVLNEKKPPGWEPLSSQAIALLKQIIAQPTPSHTP